NPADARASRAAAGIGRARPAGRRRPSDRQALATSSPARCQNPTSARGLHPGAEAMFLGAVTLLGLIGLLHRACSGSSPSGLGVPSVIDPTRHANAPGAQSWRGAVI